MQKPETHQAEKQSLSANGCRALGRVTRNVVRGGMVQLTVTVPGWTKAAAGQFALLQAEPSACFLGRALSVSSQRGEKVSFVVAPIGEGTRELCALKKGSAVWVLGPLGNGYDLGALTEGSGRVMLVGGGVGLAPFPLLLDDLVQHPAVGAAGASAGPTGLTGSQGVGGEVGWRQEMFVLLGFRDAGQAEGARWLEDALVRSEEAGLDVTVETATEDGSSGVKGKVTDLVRQHLRSGDRLAVCGPEAMALDIWRVCTSMEDVKAWFSLEANMACGVGSCHGCVVALKDGLFARVCREGPVFAGEEIFGG
jgi:dihydroorotate dehydrogenase electron transfer subunit